MPVRSLIALTVCALPWAAPVAASSFSTTLSGFVDDADGTSVDLDVFWEPADWLALGAGLGSTGSSADLADLRGDALRASVELRGAAVGGRLRWRNWRDADDFESDALVGEVYWRGGAWQLGMIAERRRFSIDYTVLLLGRPILRTTTFEGVGYGAEASWLGTRWSGYLRAVGYDYDATLERTVAASRAPNLARFPRVQALVGSLLTRTASAIDHDISSGLERSFQRASLRIDVSATRDAVSGADSRGASLAYGYSLSPRLAIEATIGAVDSDGLDSVGFAGLALTVRN